MAEPLPIFEQARSDWFESGGPPTPTPYPPLSARFPAAEDHVQPPVSRPREFHASVRPPLPEAPPPSAPPPARAAEDPFLEWREGPLPDPRAAAPYGRQPGSEPDRGFWGEPDRDFSGEPSRESWAGPDRESPAGPGHDFSGGPDDFADEDEPETTAGLPRRVPRTNLAPGILAQRERAMRDEANDVPRPARSPEEVRSLLASYRAGLERGRRSASDRMEGETAGWDADAVIGNEHDEPG